MSLRALVLTAAWLPAAAYIAPSGRSLQALEVRAGAGLADQAARAPSAPAEGESSGLLALLGAAGAGAALGGTRRRQALSAAAAAAVGLSSTPALARYDPDAQLDLNNAGAKDYRALPGIYPTISAIILNHQGEFEQVSDLYKLPELTQDMKDLIKRYEKNLTVSEYKIVNPLDERIGNKGY
mmetsp:Transcript_58970/g.128029  ORF Transcript_58970/g.128029 Transcript_58970/m.128029 type:complete len:182 (-) Transcript_58970:60-605(-)